MSTTIAAAASLEMRSHFWRHDLARSRLCQTYRPGRRNIKSCNRVQFHSIAMDWLQIAVQIPRKRLHQRHIAFHGFFCQESQEQARTLWDVTATHQSSRSSYSTWNVLAACNRSKKCQRPTDRRITQPTTTDITNQSHPSIWDHQRRWGELKCSKRNPLQRCPFTTTRQRWLALSSLESPRLLLPVSYRRRVRDNLSSPSSARNSCFDTWAS